MSRVEWTVSPADSRALGIATYFAIASWEAILLIMAFILLSALIVTVIAGAWADALFLAVLLLLGGVGLLGLIAVYILTADGRREVISLLHVYAIDFEYLDEYLEFRWWILSTAIVTVGFVFLSLGGGLIAPPLGFAGIVVVMITFAIGMYGLSHIGDGWYNPITGDLHWNPRAHGWYGPQTFELDGAARIKHRQRFGVHRIVVDNEGRSVQSVPIEDRSILNKIICCSADRSDQATQE